MENGRIAKRVYDVESMGSHLVGRPRKRWIDSVNDCFKGRGLNAGEASRMMYSRSEWRELVRGSAWAIAQGRNPDFHERQKL